MKNIFLLMLFSCFTLPFIGQNLTSNSTGSFTYIPTGALSSKSIEVFYYIPNGNITTMPILMSFHGAGRNADDYRDYWINMANSNKFMVFAPKFSDEDFPGGDAYNLANIFKDGDNPTTATFNPKEEWSFSVIDLLFAQIKADVSGNQHKYNAWGHSAGAQFLQRFVMYEPNSNLDIAVCSNAGWYTVPEFSVDFPYGVKNGQLPNSDIKMALSKKLIVHLGTNDTDENSSGLRHNTTVDNQQGLNRLVRGRYFFTESQATAQTLNTSFNWEKDEVSGVAHKAQKMANDALKHILKSTLSMNQYFDNMLIKVYPNPAKNFLYFDNSKVRLSTIDVFSIQGKLILSINFKDSETKQQIDISKLSKGIYFLKGENFIRKIVKE